MKTLFVVAVLMVSGCVQSGTSTGPSKAICKEVDTKTGVVCYFNCYFTHHSGISCVKIGS